MPLGKLLTHFPNLMKMSSF